MATFGLLLIISIKITNIMQFYCQIQNNNLYLKYANIILYVKE